MNPTFKAVIVCVDYGDILALTLPYNRHHFDKVVIVTTPADQETIQVAEANDCHIHMTSAFYEAGAVFNKWTPLEDGLDILGRSDWIVIMDADIAWPKTIPMQTWDIKVMYSPRRYMTESIFIPEESDWPKLPIHPVGHIWAGYTQIFHASAAPPLPWHKFHDNAGGPDTIFQSHWRLKHRLSWKCLHIGPSETNWGGRISPKADGTIIHPSLVNKIDEIKTKHKNQFRRYTK